MEEEGPGEGARGLLLVIDGGLKPRGTTSPHERRLLQLVSCAMPGPPHSVGKPIYERVLSINIPLISLSFALQMHNIPEYSFHLLCSYLSNCGNDAFHCE